MHALLLLALLGAAPTADELRSVLEERIASGRQPGLVVGVVEGKSRSIVAAGVMREDGPKVDGDTVFEIGSVTKVFTAALLTMMAASGEIGLDDPVSKHLPLEGKPTGAITLRQLAMHTSGLPRLPGNFAPKDGANPYVDYGAEELLAYLSEASPERTPGTAYAYSNVGTGLLGHVLSVRAKKPYEELLRERILAPLGMKDTSLVVPKRLRSKEATGHTIGAAVPHWDFDVLAGAGAIRSTVNDMMKFVDAFAGGSFAKTGTAMLATSAAADTPTTRIALGWHVTERFGKKVVWHNGMTGGFASYVAFEPGTRRGVVVLTNAAQSSEEVGMLVLAPRLLLSKLPQLVKPKQVAVAPEVLDRYVGRYELAPDAMFDIKRQGDTLTAQLTAQAALPVYPSSETEFFYRAVEAKLVFVVEAGKVTKLVLHQGGRELPAKRLP